ncbi:MAG: hypothetical protein M1814_002946 [Vezdaea aestivalis]|nr:MAG: hypothetical protein M1814_002946 [Vezdaea aestivalis]
MATTPLKVTNLILGSGQGGTALAQALARAGQATALIERSHIGGCCVNEGCTPTKTLIASGRVAYLARRAGDYGVGVGGEVRVEMEKVRQRKRDIVESFRGGGERKTEAAGVRVLMGEGRFVGERRVKVGATEVSAERVFVSTGERPAKLTVEGLETVESARVLDSTSVQELGEVPRRLIVLGGGYIGLEFGQLFRRLGAGVTIIQRAKQLLPKEDPQIAAALLQILKEDGVKVLLDSSAVKVSASETDPIQVTVKAKSGEESVVGGDYLLAAAGRTPNTDMLDLAAGGIKADTRGHIVVNDQLETSAPGVWALGDATGPPAFTHIAYNHFRILKNNVLDAADGNVKLQSKKDQIVPYVCYTDPQMGHVGLHESEAKALFPDRKIKTAKMPMAYVARALETDETRGLMKAVVDESGEILGFSCLGIEGGEIMTVVQMAMMGGLTWMNLRDATFAHPSLAESLNNLWGFLD